LQLVSIGAVIAFPIAWIVMHNWLQDYAYRVTINWWVFLLAAIAALIITLITISYQAIKAAVMNPSEVITHGIINREITLKKI
jgi:putative ABC transport system permease protein